jgi:hypothetical protein
MSQVAIAIFDPDDDPFQQIRRQMESVRSAIQIPSSALEQIGRQNERCLKLVQGEALAGVQSSIRAASIPNSALEQIGRQNERCLKLVQGEALAGVQSSIRAASIPSSTLEQLQAVLRSPVREAIDRQFAQIRRQVELATGPLPELPRVTTLGAAIDVGFDDARTISERWAALPTSKRLALDGCLLGLFIALGQVVADFAPSETLTRTLHLLAVLAALHALMVWADDALGDCQ